MLKRILGNGSKATRSILAHHSIYARGAGYRYCVCAPVHITQKEEMKSAGKLGDSEVLIEDFRSKVQSGDWDSVLKAVKSAAIGGDEASYAITVAVDQRAWGAVMLLLGLIDVNPAHYEAALA